MDDENQELDSGLSGLGPEEEEGEETASITAAATLGALPIVPSTAYSKAAGKYEKYTEDYLSQIRQAREKLERQPTQKTRGQYLRGLARALTAPREPDDPRFYERKNLYTFLRDVGEYGTAQEEAEKKVKADREKEVARLRELEAKYGSQYALEAMKEQRAYEKAMQPTRAARAPTSEFERLISGLPDDVKDRLRRQYLEKLTTRPPRAEKEESDPDRPSTVVQSRVATVRDRKLGPVGEKLSSVSQAQALLNAAQKGSPTASSQLDRYLAGLQGDKQLSMLEVSTIANAGSFPARMISSISKFLSGVPSDLSLEDKAKVLSIIEEQLAPQYNSGRESVLDTFSGASDISQSAVERIVGPKWITSAEKIRRAAEEKRIKEERDRIQKETKGESSITLTGGKSGRLVQ